MSIIKEAVEKAKEGGFPNPWKVSESVIESDEYRREAIRLAGVQKEVKILQSNADERKKIKAIESIVNKVVQSGNKLFVDFEEAGSKIDSYIEKIFESMSDIAQLMNKELNDEKPSIGIIENGLNMLIGTLSVLQLFLTQVSKYVKESTEQIKNI